MRTKKWEVEARRHRQVRQGDGRACRVWDIKRNGELDDRCAWCRTLAAGKENFQVVFANFAKVFEEMAKSVPMLAGMMNKRIRRPGEGQGLPVRSRAYDDGKLGDVEQLVKVWREEAVPASMFEIPAGYKPKKMATPGDDRRVPESDESDEVHRLLRRARRRARSERRRYQEGVSAPRAEISPGRVEGAGRRGEVQGSRRGLRDAQGSGEARRVRRARLATAG
jgi:hypothetical protein